MADAHPTEGPSQLFPEAFEGAFPEFAVLTDCELELVHGSAHGLRTVLGLLEGDELSKEMNPDADGVEDLRPRLTLHQRAGLLSAAKALAQRIESFAEDRMRSDREEQRSVMRAKMKLGLSPV